MRVSGEVSKKKKNNDIESWLTAGCHTCWQLHGNQMKRFYSVVHLQTCRLHLPFIRCLPGNVQFEESSLASYLDILFTDWNGSESNNQSLHSDKFKRRSRVTIQFRWQKMRKRAWQRTIYPIRNVHATLRIDRHENAERFLGREYREVDERRGPLVVLDP